jgi:hypothetical protein
MNQSFIPCEKCYELLVISSEIFFKNKDKA